MYSPQWVNLASVLGQVASQTRHEGASDARRTPCTLSVAGDRVTKYGEANWPSLVLGQVASQTRHEGASDARRTPCTLSVAGDRVTKYGEANWPSTGVRWSSWPARR